jgi:hypothetical protein
VWLIRDIHRTRGEQNEPLPGRARDIACGADGSLYVIGLSKCLFRWNDQQHDREVVTGEEHPLAALAVDASGTLYVVDEANNIFQMDGGHLHLMPGQAKHIGMVATAFPRGGP